jgi:hypothetical protein
MHLLLFPSILFQEMPTTSQLAVQRQKQTEWNGRNSAFPFWGKLGKMNPEKVAVDLVHSHKHAEQG